MRHLLAALMLMASAPFFCQDDCDLFNIQELASENQELHDSIAQFSVDTILLQPDGSYEVLLSNGTTFMQVQGCTNSTYLEYNAAANTDDGSCATLIVNGCTDPAYVEYNASANTDDGSCSTAVIEGCTDPAYTEYNASANTDDGSCTTPVVEGCTDPAYTEYDASANTDDGSCSTAVVEGCTDPTYLEFDLNADVDDGSCTTPVVEGCTDPAYTEYNASANTDDGSCVTLVVEGCTDAADANYDPAANTDDGSCASCSSIEFDDYTYSVVEIGDQCWFAENLRTTVYADDSDIPGGVLGNAEWRGLSTGARCDYDNNASNVAPYGRLYNWYAVNNGSGLCPSGWHVPTHAEWTELEDYLGANGHSGAEGTALKSTSGWNGGGNGTDDFGFSALPGGYRFSYIGYFLDAGDYGYWWSSSPSGGDAWYRSLYRGLPGIYRDSGDPRRGFSVRCLRDAD